MSQSLVNESGGARTPLSGLVAAGVILLVVLFFSGLLRDLPQPVLAAIVLFAVTGLFKLSALKRLWHFNRGEFLVAMAALLGVLGSGLLRGVLIGAVLSVVMLLRRGSSPAYGGNRARARHGFLRRPAASSGKRARCRAFFVFRVDGALLYFNVDFVRDRLEEALAARGDKIGSSYSSWERHRMSTWPGPSCWRNCARPASRRGIAFRLAEARGNVRDALHRAGYDDREAPLPAHQTVKQVIDSWRAGQSRS